MLVFMTRNLFTHLINSQESLLQNITFGIVEKWNKPCLKRAGLLTIAWPLLIESLTFIWPSWSHPFIPLPQKVFLQAIPLQTLREEAERGCGQSVTRLRIQFYIEIPLHSSVNFFSINYPRDVVIACCSVCQAPKWIPPEASLKILE